MTGAASPSLPEDFLDCIDQQLGDTDTFLARCYPGEDARRQPVHTVYVPADHYSADLPWQWGNAAMALVDEHGGIEALCTDLGSDLSFCGAGQPEPGLLRRRPAVRAHRGHHLAGGRPVGRASLDGSCWFLLSRKWEASSRKDSSYSV